VSAVDERALVFECRGERLLGILHAPESAGRRFGVLVVVGGPQYRAGSHRQFVLMARQLAAAGYPVLRFDHRGIGDSDGAARSFEDLDDDLRAALDTLHAQCPGLAGTVIFGLCDAASAALMYCAGDARLKGLILANPWVHSEAGAARAYVRHYYWQRLLQRGFWRKVLAGEFDLRGSLSDFAGKLLASRRSPSDRRRESFQRRMLAGLESFRGDVLLLMSGRDLTAAEFDDLSRADERWRRALGRDRVSVRRYDRADHTFAAADSFAESMADCRQWLDGLASR